MYWINGVLNAQLPPSDRTVHFGDGFFTTARLLSGKIVMLENHLKRLSLAGQRLFFVPFDTAILKHEMQVSAQICGNGAMKILISRGSGGVGYSFRDCDAPRRIILQSYIPSYYSSWRYKGVRLVQSPIRLARNVMLAGIKHNNRLEQILIRSYLDRSDAEEIVVMDNEDYVVECCSANIFWRYGNKVFTPDLHYAGVSGVMRNHIMSLLPMLGYTIEEVYARINDLIEAEEVFITNALLPIAPVRELCSRRYTSRKLYLQVSPLC